MASSRDQIKDLFFAALELPAADRPKFLADIDDAALRAEVMASLRGMIGPIAFARTASRAT